MINKMKNKEKGFLQIIIFIIIALLIMKFLGVTVSRVWNWFVSFFSGVFQ